MGTAPTRLLHDVVLRSRDRYPSAPALEVGGDVWSYDELVSTARRIARNLESSNSRRVALVSNPALETYAAYLGILLAGRTVVPIHFQAPDARVSAILSAAESTTIIAPPSWPHAHGLIDAAPQVLMLDSIADSERFSLSPRPTAEPSAYVLFTSGSTGAPKGVPVTHRAARAYIDYTIDRLRLPQSARVSQCFDLSFDVSVHDMFLAWGAGATLVVPTRLDMLDPVLWVNSERITHWASVPSSIATALARRNLTGGALPHLARSAFLGEPLKLQMARAWAEAAPSSLIENSYGPTELTIAVASFTLPLEPKHWPQTRNQTVPIGHIYPHLEWKVVGDEPSPMVGEGELWVRGPQRFDGYLDPSQDTNKLVDDDGTASAGATGADPSYWYRTGDWVGVHPDGLVHLGRIDDQVKVRGFRVELGEIEAVLLKAPGITNAVAFTRPGRHGALDLLCCYEGEIVDQQRVKQELASALPPYMVPNRLIHMAQIPLTSSGKVDRNALRMLSDGW